MKRIVSLMITCILAVAVMAGCSFQSSSPLFDSEQLKKGEYLGYLTTDKAMYEPGEKVEFSLSLKRTDGEGTLLIRYLHLNELVEEKEISLSGDSTVSWDWKAKEEDFKGYMVEVYMKDGKDIVDHTNIALDVSSDWAKFPRYGYLADFYELPEDEQQSVIDKLNRFHINGVQFYDWQYKHEQPLKMENGDVADTWPDIANREVSRKTIENYISMIHEKNMKAMNYNLLFGAYENYEEEGVKKEWGIYRDPLQNNQDMHPLPESWASDIYLMNPANEEWQEFIITAEREVFKHLAFDGWHVDQLGDRGTLWDGAGNKIDLSTTYVPFLQKAKDELDVSLVMNAVSQYAQGYIATQAPVDFLYSELWDGHQTFGSLKDVIDQNYKFSNNELNTVLAAYMNYDLSDSMGEFNAPGVLLTNAVIFAAGGAHLELGENMLSKEYFPHKKLSISEELTEELIHYYDFTVAYQNLLRDGAEEVPRELTVNDGDIKVSSRSELGSIWSYTKEKDNLDILQFINLTDANSLEWRDNDGSQVEPAVKEDVKVKTEASGKVAKVWLASPDFHGGSAIELDFDQKGETLEFSIPKLKYWNMVVVEYK
ncbi:glycoside hydrolase family 66 protein [Sutcliffiella horikoshii]|uniref:glycoside hydrolase family 66 protein n=1 Tax=Sutcliffiella horikoshii TaxID=79883 RepID=UPI00203BBDA5|nr:glycoside hydrolase family 66 protein [Sutcliffiella horikoshii]MCM3618471.1 glycoside hydrolase family 66 protein [Sutcliffiella horikoshii]